jgi:hypothetical protein
LEDRSRAPRKRREREITPLQEKRIVELKKANIRYGKLKISTLYEQAYGERISSWKIQKTIEKYHSTITQLNRLGSTERGSVQ